MRILSASSILLGFFPAVAGLAAQPGTVLASADHEAGGV